jgi:Xaa-Pro aminopeptidase
MSGERTVIGGMATARKLKTGENVIIDLWVIGNNYWSDTCRTFFVDGRCTQQQREILEMLEETKRRAARAIRPGVRAADIYRQAQRDLKKHGYTCPHHIGHGIGLEFWEPPFITADSPDVFKKDMALAIEVGVYIEKDLGFRVEDNHFVTATGVRRFTSPHIA